jgi:hypothetical protein
MPYPRSRSRTLASPGWRRAAAVTTLLCLTAASGIALGEEAPRIPASEAAFHVGELATVCGHVASAAYIASTKGTPTFLNVGRPYPDQDFTAVIWGPTRARFEQPPERLFDRKTICVTGRIEAYQGKPQIVVESPDQILVEAPAGGGNALSEFERVLVKALLSGLGHETDFGTGEWNERTVEAVIAFQEESGLTPTGDPDPATLRAMAAAVGEIPEADRTMVIRLLLFEIVRGLE